MTLTREQRAAYGPTWDDVSRSIREDRALGRCECEGECGWTRHPDGTGRCLATNGAPSPYTGSRVVLTVAHLDQNGHEGEHQPDRLKAMCQGCHLAYDRHPRSDE